MRIKESQLNRRLGLVCITHSEEIRYKTTTRKHLLTLSENEQKEKLRNIYAENTSRLKRAVEYCLLNNINLYRMTSALFPFADDYLGEAIMEEFAGQLYELGTYAWEQKIRLVLHPDQFVVLSSDSPNVVENSIKILKYHAKTMDLLNQPRSEWAAINIHGGKANRTDKLVSEIDKLPDEIRSRLTFENDEYAYSSSEILEVCQRAGVPMIFDAHHHVCREGLEDYNDPSVAEMFWAARETWQNPDNQMVHISNGRERFTDRAHSDLIFTMPDVFQYAPWIEVEAKHKEMAITQLQRDWLPLLAEQKNIINDV